MEDVIVKTNQKEANLFLNRNFILLYLGGVVSWFGNNIYYIALCWFILDKLKSPLFLGSAMMMGSIPEIVFGPICGVVVDRVDRKKIIIFMDIFRGIMILFLSTYLNNENFYPLLLAVTFLMALCDSFFSPAVSATIPNIVEKNNLIKANSIMNLSNNSIKVLGLAIGGLMIGFVGVKGVFIINGFSFLLSAFSEMFIQIPAIKDRKINLKAKSTFKNDLKEGFKFIFSNKVILIVSSIAILLNFFFVGSLSVALPYIVKEILHLGEANFGLIEVFFPIGAILGGVILNVIPEIKKIHKFIVNGLIALSFIMFSIGITLVLNLSSILSTMTSFWIIGFSILGVGVISILINVPIFTVFQHIIPDEFRGRFFGTFNTFTQGLIPIAYLISGLILGIGPAHLLIFVGGSAILLLALGLRNNEEIKNIKL